METYTRVDRKKARARAAACVANYHEAAQLAMENGMRLVSNGEQHYRLIREKPRGIWHLYPRRGRDSPRIIGDDLHRGGILRLKVKDWTLLDVVKAAVELSVKEGYPRQPIELPF